MDCSDTEIPFLDVLVKLDNIVIHNGIFSKYASSHNYLDFDSSQSKYPIQFLTIVIDEDRRQDSLR